MRTTYRLKNFRVFGEKGASFRLTPITILTGCNSSGKSSLIKSMLLLQSNIGRASELRQEGEDYCAIAFVFENNATRQPVRDAVVSVNDVEALIGYDLFTNLDDRLEESIESQANWDEWTH